MPRTAGSWTGTQNEERSIDYVVLGLTVAGRVPAPSVEELAKYFDDRKALFTESKAGFLGAHPRRDRPHHRVSDADAKRAYEDRLARYSTPEVRGRAYRIPNDEEANKAVQRLKEKGTRP